MNLCSPFSRAMDDYFRDLPRITVRGHSVQGAGFALRKALLRSRVCPWSTRRPCGPLAFRRVAAGELGQRKVWGVKRGKETIWCPCPFCPLPGTRHLRRRRRPLCTLTPSVNLASNGRPLYRRNRFPSAEGKTKIASAPGREHFFHSPEGFSAMR